MKQMRHCPAAGSQRSHCDSGPEQHLQTHILYQCWVDPLNIHAYLLRCPAYVIRCKKHSWRKLAKGSVVILQETHPAEPLGSSEQGRLQPSQNRPCGRGRQPLRPACQAAYPAPPETKHHFLPLTKVRPPALPPAGCQPCPAPPGWASWSGHCHSGAPWTCRRLGHCRPQQLVMRWQLHSPGLEL